MSRCGWRVGWPWLAAVGLIAVGCTADPADSPDHARSSTLPSAAPAPARDPAVQQEPSGLVVDVSDEATEDQITALRVFLTSVTGAATSRNGHEVSLTVDNLDTEAEWTLAGGLDLLGGHRSRVVVATDGTSRPLAAAPLDSSFRLFQGEPPTPADPSGIVRGLEAGVIGELTAPSQVRLVPYEVWKQLKHAGPGSGLVWVVTVHGRIPATHSMPEGAEVDDYDVISTGPMTTAWGDDFVRRIDAVVLGPAG